MPLLSESIRNLAASMTIAALVIAGLVVGRDILIPLTVAMLVAFILTPVVRRIHAYGMARAPAVLLTVTLVSGLLVGISGVVSNELVNLTAEISTYKSNIIQKVRAVTGVQREGGALAKATAAVESLGNDLKKEINGGSPNDLGQTRARTPDGQTPTVDRAPQPPPTSVVVTQSSREKGNPFLDVLGTVSQPLAQAALTFLFAIFLMLQYQDLRDRIVRVFGADNMSDTTSAMTEAGSRLSGLFVMQAILNGAFGLFVGVALWLIGVPNSALWGLLAAIMRFVPYVGSILAAVPPIFLAAAVDPGWVTVSATLAVFLIGEPIMGHVVEPLILGKRAGISPFAMVASASFWTLIWGPIGLILAAPLTMGLIVLGRYIDGLHIFTVLLGDEPPLSQEQQFYNRLLSDDPVAALAALEKSANETSVGLAVETLALPALALAAYDHRLGRLDAPQIANVSRSVAALSDNISILETANKVDEAVASKPRHTILAIPVRGPVDVAAAALIARAIGVCDSTISASATDSSGLTALSSARNSAGADAVDAILIVTVGGADTSQLTFVAKRAERDFPESAVMILDIERPDSGHSHAHRQALEGLFPSLKRFTDVVGNVRTAQTQKRKDRLTGIQSSQSSSSQTSNISPGVGAMPISEAI
jgi:predicted PurR-regulated permease PerM